MAVVNPFADDVDRGPAWESGYEAGFSEPELDHTAPFAPELIEVFLQGEQTGRDDRRSEPASQDPLPAHPDDMFSHFESAPDGTLIPVPDEAPGGNRIRDDATVTVNPRTSAGYYVTIFNASPESAGGEFSHILTKLLTEAAIARLEHMLAEAAVRSATTAIKFGGLFVSVAISVLTPSPILRESRFRGYLPDETPISYVVLDPVH